MPEMVIKPLYKWLSTIPLEKTKPDVDGNLPEFQKTPYCKFAKMSGQTVQKCKNVNG